MTSGGGFWPSTTTSTGAAAPERFPRPDRSVRVGGLGSGAVRNGAPRQSAEPVVRLLRFEIEYGRTSGPITKARQAAKIIFSLEARRKIRALVDRVQPSVAHAHNVYHHISPSIFDVLKAEGVPVVMTAHDLKLACPAYKMLSQGEVCERCRGGRIHNVLLRRCVKDSAMVSGLVFLETLVHRSFGLYRDTLDCLIAPSRFYRDKLVQWGWDASRIAYIPNFVDAEQFTPWCHGELLRLRGTACAGEGARHAGASRRACASAAGAGRQRPRRGRPAPARIRARRRGCLRGSSGQAGAEAADRRIACAVLASEWYENAPISVLEAYALGRPVIGTRIGGIPELIVHNKTGALVEPGNVGMLAEALASMAKLPRTARNRLGAAGRDWVLREFTPEKYRDRITALYETVVH